MKTFLLDHKISVQNICESQRKKEHCVMVQLTDSKNTFTVDLLENLWAAMLTLRNKVAVKVVELNLAEGKIKDEIDNVYIR